MTRDDVLDILEKMPREDQCKMVLVLKGMSCITLDAIARTEDDYLVLRGREGGTNDDGRGFFLPYDEIQYIKFDRIVSAADLKLLYGEKVAPRVEETAEEKAAAEAKPADPKKAAADPKAVPSTQTAAMDPAAIAKQNLLARIRAVRGITSTSTS